MTASERDTWPERRPVAIVRGHRTHVGWWRMEGSQVNLESDYGAARATVAGMSPDKIAADLLGRLVEQSGGRRFRQGQADPERERP